MSGARIGFGKSAKVTASDTMPLGSERTGAAFLLAAAVLWSLNGVLIKHLFAAGLSGWGIAGFRSLFAALILTPFVVRRLRPIANPGWVAAALVAFTAMCATFVIATTRTTAANAIVLQYTAPLWVFLVAPLVVGDRAVGRQYVALVCSLLGVAVIFLSQYSPGQSGLLIALSSGLVFGLQSVFFRRVRAVDPLVMAWLACTVSGILLVGVALLAGPIQLSLPLTGWLVMMGVVQFGIPYVLYSAGLRRVSAQQGILLILLEPVLNPVWVWLVVGEVPHWGTLVGGGLILFGVLYLSLPQILRSTRYPVQPR